MMLPSGTARSDDLQYFQRYNEETARTDDTLHQAFQRYNEARKAVVKDEIRRQLPGSSDPANCRTLAMRSLPTGAMLSNIVIKRAQPETIKMARLSNG
jgi:hypothetical protein